MKKFTQKQKETIWKIFEIQPNIYIFLLDTMSDRSIVEDECNRNIYCCNENDEILWQVQYPRNSFEENPVYINIGTGK